MKPPKPTLITISVQKIQQEPYISSEGRILKSAVIEGVSENPEDSFELKTGLLNPEQLYCCELLQQHGSTVVEVPENWRWEYYEPDRLREAVIKAAMERIKKRYQSGESIEMAGTYDGDFAEQVLVEINKRFPNPVQTMELKHAFENEPTDSQLLTALAGLQREGFIEGRTLLESMSGRRELAAMANIEITAEGRRHLSGASATSAAATIIHGDQFNNYGQTGAMGHHSTGTVNFQNQWASLERQFDLSAISNELRSAVEQLRQTASSSEDFQRLQLLSQAREQAEKKDGGKLLQSLSKIGQSTLPVLTKCGAELIVRLMEHHFKLAV